MSKSNEVLELLRQIEPGVKWLHWNDEHEVFFIIRGGESNRIVIGEISLAQLDAILGAILGDIRSTLEKLYPDPDYKPFIIALQYGEGHGEEDPEHPESTMRRGWFFAGGAEESQWEGFDADHAFIAALRGYIEFREVMRDELQELEKINE